MSEVLVEGSRSIDNVEARLRQGGYGVERITMEYGSEDGTEEEQAIVVEWPSGRGTRRITYDEDDAARLQSINPDEYRLLGDLDALVNVKTGTIEVRIAPLARMGVFPRRNLASLPGVEQLGGDDKKGSDDPADDGPLGWRLQVASGNAAIEVGPATDEFKAIFAMSWRGLDSMRFRGFSSNDQDSALEVLNTYGRSFLLDLDLRYGAGYGLFERGAPRRRTNATPIAKPPVFPKNRYAPEPLSLYTYGRSAAGLPLLEYLAYYQAVEFYFPIIAQEETVRSIAATLRDPRFNYADEGDIRRLISLASPSGQRGRVSEQDQLRLTVRSVVDVATLRSFIESNPRVAEHLCTKAQTIRGVERLQLNSTNADLRDQVADRIYAIRCRIVHTKDDGGESGVELLLPSSREARSLGPDVDLVRLLAEQTLVARAVPLRL